MRAENGDIDRVGANIWIDGKGPALLLLRDVPAPTFMNLVSNQQVLIPICMTYKDDSGEYLWFHLDVELGPLDLRKMRANKTYVDLDVQFIGKDYSEQPRRLRLHFESWEEINLTLRD